MRTVCVIITFMESSDIETDVEETSELESGAEKETSLESQPQGGALKREKYPKYKGFDGRFRRLDEVRDRIPAFRDFFIKYRFESGSKLSAMKIVDMFNDITPPGDFFPQPAMYQRWRKQWEAEQAGLIKTAETRLAERSKFQIINPEGATIEKLEDSMTTLGAELANDAIQTLRDTQEREEYFEDEVVVKRKAYALNVFAFVTKAAHSKTALRIKQQGEARETAGFMLDLIRRATAGNLKQEEIDMLRGSVRIEVDTTKAPEHGIPTPASVS